MEHVSGRARNDVGARILVVDDEQEVVSLLNRALTECGYQVSCAVDGVGALAEAKADHFDLVILDINMPKIDGYQVCLRLRAEPGAAHMPILFVSGRDTIEDRLLGFEVGCDDYVVKPFDMDEFLARVKALVRRSRLRPPEETRSVEQAVNLQSGSLVLDLRLRQVSRGLETVQLTTAEFDLLKFLMERPDEIHSSQALLREVWGYPADSSGTGLVRWHIRNLRGKIEPDPVHPTHIRTVPHQGYVFDRDPRP